MNNDGITVLTVTKKRPQLLKRCLKSVMEQECDLEVRHLILIDDCPDTYEILNRHYQPSQRLIWFLRPRSPKEKSGPEHLARLRNLQVRMAETKWISFLDDDNEYEPFHLRQLIESVRRTGSPAVHSWIQLFNFDGTPYLEERWPWCRDEKIGRQRYREMADKGVICPGYNIVRDSIHNLPARCVDTSAWLLSRDIF